MTVDKKQIEHPEHYARMQVVIEPRHLTELFTGDVSNVLKYLCRAGFKEGESREKDLLKARQYALFAIETDYAYDRELAVCVSDLCDEARYVVDKLPKDLVGNKVRLKCWIPHTCTLEADRYAHGVIAIMRAKSNSVDTLFYLSAYGRRASPEYNTTITSAGLMALVQLIDKELAVSGEK